MGEALEIANSSGGGEGEVNLPLGEVVSIHTLVEIESPVQTGRDGRGAGVNVISGV